VTDAPAALTAALADRYQVIRQVGEGGMATVFLAQDLRHGRQVALKVLRADVAAAIGAERFVTEIRTTAHLQHPHILPLFDSGRVDGTAGTGHELLFYVMPFVEGESLRQRLTRERQLPVDEAVRLACEVADALDYAHRRGVLHRDIKPENILLHDGHALVADFGIALALSRADGAGRLTQTGLSLGTPQYMSPEQALGEQQLDARTDIYALGATLYEMLTGEPPHTGPTPQVILARAATDTPRPIRATRAVVPEPLEEAVLAALRPIPADRYGSAAEFARAIRQAMTAQVTTTGLHARPAGGRRLPGWTIAGAAALLVLATALGTRWWVLRNRGNLLPAQPARLMLPLPAGQLLRQGLLPFDVSRDGSKIVYAANVAGTARLYLRRLDQLDVVELRGTEGAELPFFSPTGDWVAYTAEGKLWKVARTGGAPIPVADVRTGTCGASWGADDVIYLGRCDGRLHQVSPQGGEVTSIEVVEEPTTGAGSATPAVTNLRWPSLLPDGKHVLVATARGIGVVELSTGRLRTLLPGGQPRYLPSGHLFFEAGEGRIRVVPFDLRRLEVKGEAVPAFETFRGPGDGGAFIAAAGNGTVVYVAGGFDRSLVFTDRNGRPAGIELEKRGYRFPRFSPDGRLVAVVVDPRPSDLWLVDPARGQSTRLTTDGSKVHPTWSPDGARIAFTTTGGMAWMDHRGGDEHPILRFRPGTAVRGAYPTSWLPDGRLLAFWNRGSSELVTVSPGDTVPTLLLATPANERSPQISPDGRWVAYTSDVSGKDEVYVRALEGSGAGELVSRGGGEDPRWSRHGAELLYRRGTSIMAAEVRTRPTFQVTGVPRELFATGYDFSQSDNWDVTADGQRFVFVASDAASTRGFSIVLDWFEELRGELGARPDARP
jgi:serine/threonine-protein kinase